MGTYTKRMLVSLKYMSFFVFLYHVMDDYASLLFYTTTPTYLSYKTNEDKS